MNLHPHERIFVAVDTNDVQVANRIVQELKGKVGGFKIGLEFIMSAFAQLAVGDYPEDRLMSLRVLFGAIGNNLFLDGKFSDIPNTVGAATNALGPLSPKFLNVHANSGAPAIRAAVGAKGSSQVLGVTQLTSFDNQQSFEIYEAYPNQVVLRLARILVENGVDGLICSPSDLAVINKDQNLSQVPKMTPGIRPAWSEKGDQSRITTPAQALMAGSTWMVIGRPITGYANGPVEAVERIVEEIAAVAA